MQCKSETSEIIRHFSRRNTSLTIFLAQDFHCPNEIGRGDIVQVHNECTVSAVHAV